MKELVQQCTRLYEAHKSQTALAQLGEVEWSPESGKPGGTYVDALLLKIRCLMRLERFGEAFSLADTLSTPEPPAHRAGDLLKLKGILWRLARARPDKAILELERALELTGEQQPERALIQAELAYAWAGKNCFNAAFEAIEQAYPGEDHSPQPIVVYRHGQIALLYRDLHRARSCFEELRQLPDGERLARDGLAFVELAEGNLERAGAHLDVLGPAYPDELWLRRRRLRVLAVIDPEAELALLEEVRRISPASDHADEDRCRIAELRYLFGRREEALAELEGLEPADPEIAAFAGWMREKLAAGNGPRLVRLEGVPFLSRSRETGPAAVELVLRTLRRTVEPQWIGEVATLGNAAEFFALAGLRTVRCPGALEELDLLLSAGAPVLLRRAEGGLALIVGLDRTRAGLLLREPTQFGERAEPYERLAADLDAGCLAVLPERVEPPVASHRGLLALDETPRLLARGEQAAARERLEQAAEALPDRRAPWALLLEHDLEQLEWQMGAPEALAPRIEQVLARAEAAHPEQHWVRGYRGRLHELQGELQEAVADYEAALQDAPRELGLLLRGGEACRQLNRYEASERMFWELLERAPHHVGANMSIAGLYCDMEDHRLARHFVRVAMELAPREPYNLLNQGRLREMQGHFEAAVDAYEQALLLRRGDPYLLERLGVCLSHQSRFEEAVEQIKRAIREGPPHPSARISLADVYLRWGYFDKAIDVCNELLAAEPNHPAGLAIRGAALFYLGREEQGIEQLQQALEEDRDYPWARRQLAMAYQQQHEHEQAVALLRDSVRLDSSDLWSQHQLAFSLRETGQVDAAVEELIQACRLSGFSDEHLLSALVSTLKEQGRGDEALHHARQGLAHEEGRPGFARRMVVRLLAEEDAWDEMGPHVEALLAAAPGDPEMLLYQATLARRAGDDASCDELVARALEQEGGDEDAHYRMTRLLVELERWDEAQQVFERVDGWDDPYLCFQGLKIYARHPRHSETCLELARAGNLSVGGEDYYYMTQIAYYAGSLGRREEALEAISEAIAVNAHDPWAFLLLAQTLHPLSRFDEALAAIDRAAALGESVAECAWNRIEVLSAAERWEPVEAIARDLARREEDAELTRQASIAEAEAALHLRGPDGFEQVVARIESEQPLSGDELARLAAKAYDAERWKLARRYVERALSLDPTCEQGLHHLGLLRERAGDQAAALDAYEQLVEAHPESHVGHENLGRLLARQGRLSEAADHVQLAVELEPRCSGAWSALANWELRSGGDPPAALPALVRADQIEPLRKTAQIDRALRAWLCGDLPGAARWLEQARKRSRALGKLWSEDVKWAAELIENTNLDPPHEHDEEE